MIDFMDKLQLETLREELIEALSKPAHRFTDNVDGEEIFVWRTQEVIFHVFVGLNPIESHFVLLTKQKYGYIDAVGYIFKYYEEDEGRA